MRIHIIFCHHVPGSFSAALKDAAVEVRASSAHQLGDEGRKRRIEDFRTLISRIEDAPMLYQHE